MGEGPRRKRGQRKGRCARPFRHGRGATVRQVVLDTESTGLEPEQGHRIIEIGCVELVNRRLTDRRLHYYLQPDRDIDDGALDVHGITRDFLEGKATLRRCPHGDSVVCFRRRGDHPQCAVRCRVHRP